MIKILTILGARPQFVKAAMVSRAIKKYNKHAKEKKIYEEIIHTGQHYDKSMSDIFFQDMSIPEPVKNLNINKVGHGEMTGRMLIDLEKEIVTRKPNWLLVYGDTNSTLAGALAAVKLHVPVIHVEAGLRSFNRKMPEEINRVLTDHISTILFCPTKNAIKNLKKEGLRNGQSVCGQKITVVNAGDVMFDAALVFGEISERRSTILEKLNLSSRKYFLATVHRAENVDNHERLANIMVAFGKMKLPVILPLHPRTKAALLGITSKNDRIVNGNVKIVEPVSFFDMVKLEKNAVAILTDSGGIQKEAYFHEVPCITLRGETEWTETLESGWNTLVGADVDKIVDAVLAPRPGEKTNYYGDGHASKYIVEAIAANEKNGWYTV